MPRTAGHSRAFSRILAEDLQAPDEPLTFLLRGGIETTARAVCGTAGRALLDLPAVSPQSPPWLAPHQIFAHDRLVAILLRHGGAVLADAVGLGKSYVALAVARTLGREPTLVVPAALADQWRALLARLAISGRVFSHESLSRESANPGWRHDSNAPPLVIVDEAHHFRNPDTRRYRALARRMIGARVLLVSATPVHHRAAELLHLLRLFLRDDALVAVGVPSLILAAREKDPAPAVLAAMARFVVARSRHRVTTRWRGLSFPKRTAGQILAAAPAPLDVVSDLTRSIDLLRPAGPAGPLLRLTLLRRLASSIPALRESLRRYEAFCTVAREAAALQRGLTTKEFRRLYPMLDGSDLQLTLLPLLLEPGGAPWPGPDHDADSVRQLLDRTRLTIDPKADQLERLLTAEPAKTIVFAVAAATVHHLRRRLATSCRVGAVVGTSAWLGLDRSTRREVLESFAPRAQGVSPPGAAARVDVLIATDLLGEGLNLQDAERVVHYDLPWSPARLAQRVGRVDRLASTHASIGTITFLPPEPLAGAIALERRLARKVSAQISAGAAQIETIHGATAGEGALDWCDRVQHLAACANGEEPEGVIGSVEGSLDACVLVVRLGSMVEAFVVEGEIATANAPRAAFLLEAAAVGSPIPADRGMIDQAIRATAPLVRQRCAAIAAARWRTADRDGAGRRLVSLVLAAARRAARAGQAERLARLDAVVARLCGGLTAGESLLLDSLLGRSRPLDAADLIAWHERLPPLSEAAEAPQPCLVAALLLRRGPESRPFPDHGLSGFGVRGHF
jgi:superfamily II DNA or RNA helicase